MGCGKSIAKGVDEALERSERELVDERRRLQEKDKQIQQVQASEASLRDQFSQSTEQLRSELEVHRESSRRELEQQRSALLESHRNELRITQQDRELALHRELDERTGQAQEKMREQQEVVEQAHQALVENMREAAESSAKRHREETEHIGREVERLREQFGPLRQERDEAVESLVEARALLRSEQAERADSTGRACSLERELAEAQEEHKRSEQRYADLEFHLQAQMRELEGELQTCNEELHQRNAQLQRRDGELTEVNGQLADLQGLFEDVNRQLQTECGRIEKLQDTVALCARQSKEIEQLQGMLEDSHRMLEQVREALEEERAERIRVSGLLEHEQQRTQLLLDVLKHFKEKLQGLTPQVLLSRLGGGADPQALLASVGVTAPSSLALGNSPGSGAATGLTPGAAAGSTPGMASSRATIHSLPPVNTFSPCPSLPSTACPAGPSPPAAPRLNAGVAHPGAGHVAGPGAVVQPDYALKADYDRAEQKRFLLSSGGHSATPRQSGPGPPWSSAESDGTISSTVAPDTGCSHSFVGGLAEGFSLHGGASSMGLFGARGEHEQHGLLRR